MRIYAALLTVGLLACGSDDGSPELDPDGSSSSSASDTSASDTTSAGSTTGSTAGSESSTESGDSSSGGDPLPTGGDELCLEQAVQCPNSPGYIPVADVAAAAGSGFKLLDVRGVGDFETAHIPGAVQVDPGAVRATINDVPGQVASEEDVRALWQSVGLVETDAVVVYGAGTGTDSARVVWTLAYYGHQGPMWAMDGGFAAWTGPTEAGAVTPTPSTYITAVDETLRVDEAAVLASLDGDDWVLFDARSAGEFDSGHIPGAVHVDWNTNIGPSGLLLPASELEALYGPPPADRRLVTYCQTGSRAAVDWLVLESLGFEDVRIYDGSWAEWSADPTNPVE